MAKTKKSTTGEIIVRSCRYNRKTIRCEWENAGDVYAVTFHDNPLPSFEKALAALAPIAAELFELPAKDAEKLEPTGITLRELGEDNERGLITAKKKLRKGKRVGNIATPLVALWPSKDAETKGSDAMEEHQAKAISKFAAEVKKYILGERAQGKLDFQDEDEGGDDESAPANQAEFPALAEPEKK
jgi:hypothetical protein